MISPDSKSEPKPDSEAATDTATSQQSQPRDGAPVTQPPHADAPQPETSKSDSSGDTILIPGASLTGRRIGHYLVGERLGGGLMATVYHARDEILDRDVALKVLLPGADDVTRERFRREARTVSDLKHPHIVCTFQVGQTSADGIIYIAMELVSGSTLSELLERQGKLLPTEACRLLAPIAHALHYAHERGIVHRDVKPSNILLRSVKRGTPGSITIESMDMAVIPLLSDFGIARALDAPDLTSTGRTIGTPAFMSPEQCAGSTEIDGRSDIYSLGAVLYRCIVGRTPYVGSTTQILHAHVYEPLIIPESVARTLPGVVIEIIRRSMMKDASQRYSSAALMAADFTVGSEMPIPRAEPQTRQLPPDTTATMTTVTVGAEEPGRVLVPGPTTGAQRAASSTAPSGMPAASPITGARRASALTTPKQVPLVRPTQTRDNRRPGVRLALAATMVVLVAALLGTLVWSVLPLLNFDTNPSDNAAAATTTPLTQPAAVGTDDTTATPTTASEPDASAGGPVTSTVSPTSTSTVSTPTVAPTPAIALSSAWDDAQAFYAERAWQDALTWLSLVRRIDPEFERDQVEQMLIDVYVSLATTSAAAGQLDDAAAHIDEAMTIDPEDDTLSGIRGAIEAVRQSPTNAVAPARARLQQSLAAYADRLADREMPCAAAEQVAAANLLGADSSLAAKQAAFQNACARVERQENIAELSGTILYSAQQGDRYRLLRMSVGSDSASSVILEDGAQPSLSPDGRRIAYYSTRGDMLGLAGFDYQGGPDPSSRTVRYTNFIEDARDSAPSWNPASDRLVYASTNFGDGRSRIYITWADGSKNTANLSYGKDPAWHPRQDLIVYNGVDETGNQPGLWLMRSDGTDRRRLTDNGNDQRPVWTPDGRSVVFMSSGRHDNWEVYRVELATGQITRLTFSQAQDGLPTVSPDGEHVAFLSDRNGFWQFFVIPIDGGEPTLLGRVAGELPRWLEHSIQWIP